MAARSAILYGVETAALTKIQQVDLGVAELKMSRFSSDKNGQDQE